MDDEQFSRFDWSPLVLSCLSDDGHIIAVPDTLLSSLDCALQILVWRLVSRPAFDGGLVKHRRQKWRGSDRREKRSLWRWFSGDNEVQCNVATASGHSIVNYLVSHCYFGSAVESHQRRSMAVKLARYLQVQKKVFAPFAESDQNTLIEDDEAQLFQFLRRKRIVVLGGGIGGTALIKALESQLQDDYELVLVERKPIFECIPSFPILFSDPSYMTHISNNYCNFLHKTLVVQDTVLELRHHSVILERNGELSFDYCAIATGSSSMIPFPVSSTLDNIVNSYQSSDVIRHFSHMDRVQSIAVIGGGPVAVEVTGELLHRFAKDEHKTITLFTRGERMLERLGKEANKCAMKRFCKYSNFNAVFNATVERIFDNKIYVRQGPYKEDPPLEFIADVIVLATGFSPNTSFMQRHFSHALKRGLVDVNENFMVLKKNSSEAEYHGHIFAIGDVCMIPEEKLAQTAEAHASVVTRNLLQIEKEQIHPSLIKYAPSKKFLIITLGPKYAILVKDNKVWVDSRFMSFVKTIVERKLMFTRS